MTSTIWPVYPPEQRQGADGLVGVADAPPQQVVVTRFRPTDNINTGQVGNIGSGVPSNLVGVNPLRRVVTLKNEGAVDVYVGNEGVTITTGFRIGVGQSITLETGGEVFGITPSGTGVVFWLAEYEKP